MPVCLEEAQRVMCPNNPDRECFYSDQCQQAGCYFVNREQQRIREQQEWEQQQQEFLEQKERRYQQEREERQQRQQEWASLNAWFKKLMNQ